MAILGAGNALDLDGDRLGDQFDEVHLVDIDAAALEGARTRLSSTRVASKLRLHAPVDVTGALLPAATRASMHGLESATGIVETQRRLDEVEGHFERASESVLRELPRFDVVLSDCVLTQTFCTLDEAWPVWASYPSLRKKIVETHLLLLAGLLAPGAMAYFVSDVTTSDAVPLAELAKNKSLTEVLGELSARGELFGNLDPLAIQGFLRTALVDGERLEEVSLSQPWLWQVLPERMYLVIGHRFCRAFEGT